MIESPRMDRLFILLLIGCVIGLKLCEFCVFNKNGIIVCNDCFEMKYELEYGYCDDIMRILLTLRFFSDISAINIINNKNISNINVNINMNSINSVDLNLLHIISNFKYILCHLRKYNIPSILAKNEMQIDYERQKEDMQDKLLKERRMQ